MLYALNLRAVCRLYLNRKEGKDSENNKYLHNKGIIFMNIRSHSAQARSWFKRKFWLIRFKFYFHKS